MGIDVKSYEPHYISIRGKGDVTRAFVLQLKSRKVYLAKVTRIEEEAIAAFGFLAGTRFKRKNRVVF